MFLAALSLGACNTTGGLAGLNYEVNHQIEYTSEPVDTWQSAEQTEERGAGDCEDFAILKMAKLPAGFTANLILVKALQNNQYHVVLRTIDQETGAIFYLDNMRDELVPHDKFAFYFDHVKTLQPWATTRYDMVYGSAAK
jgi:predicted transglutaminase-like cysteine proteinase